MLIVAATQSVKVVNWPTPTPAPLHNIALPYFDVAWATFWVAAIALFVACVAAYYAGRAFKSAQADLEISKANWSRATRAPDLAASFQVEQPGPTFTEGCPRGNHIRYSMPELVAVVWNTDKGQRRCEEFLLGACRA
jgi:hypothetical protein